MRIARPSRVSNCRTSARRRRPPYPHTLVGPRDVGAAAARPSTPERRTARRHYSFVPSAVIHALDAERRKVADERTRCAGGYSPLPASRPAAWVPPYSPLRPAREFGAQGQSPPIRHQCGLISSSFASPTTHHEVTSLGQKNEIPIDNRLRPAGSFLGDFRTPIGARNSSRERTDCFSPAKERNRTSATERRFTLTRNSIPAKFDDRDGPLALLRSPRSRGAAAVLSVRARAHY